MSPAILLAELNCRGIELQPNGDKLRIIGSERLAPGELQELCRHKTVIIGLLRSEGILAAAIDRYPIIPGRVHFDFFHTSEEIEAGRWGVEFNPGYHVDPRQPSRLTGMFTRGIEP